ncbi:hypothetical protein [Nostoc sp.]
MDGSSTPSGKFSFTSWHPSAEMERELIIAERTRAGLEVARRLGRKGGRKRQMTEGKVEAAKKLLAAGVPSKEVAKNLGCVSRHSLPLAASLKTLTLNH